MALFFAYELMRGYADKFGLPIHVTDVIAAEKIVGLGGLPTVWLQGLFHSGPASSPDNLAAISVVFYFLHFPLPLAIGFLLWIHHRRAYYDFVAALIVLSMAGFVTYLLLPVAPPWWADQYGYASGILHLRDNGFQGLATTCIPTACTASAPTTWRRSPRSTPRTRSWHSCSRAAPSAGRAG